MTRFNLCPIPGIRVLIFALAARLLCGHAIAGDVIAISDGESVNYYAFGGGELGSTNFGVSIYGLATDPSGNIIVAELNGGPVKLSGTTGSGDCAGHRYQRRLLLRSCVRQLLETCT